MILTRFVPNEELAWKTEAGSAVDHAGIVTFSDNEDGTATVCLRMTFNPPAGAVGHSIAAFLGEDAKTLLDEGPRLKILVTYAAVAIRCISIA